MLATVVYWVSPSGLIEGLEVMTQLLFKRHASFVSGRENGKVTFRGRGRYGLLSQTLKVNRELEKVLARGV